MDRVAQKIGELREQLESAAFLVAQPNKHQAAHKELLNALASLTELDVAYTSGRAGKSNSVSNVEEVNKVQRRLKLWAKRPHQLNSRILTAYLKLEKEGVSPITESALHDAVGKVPSFSSNLLQMRIIAEKNHGKVFHQSGATVMLWPPVVSAIREYGNSVLGDD